MKYDETYKDMVIRGSAFPYAPIRWNLKVRLSKEIKEEYLPVIDQMDISRGMKLLCTAMTIKEGFYKGSRSYRTNNPGNVGNTDIGANIAHRTLKDGIEGQVNYITRVATGNHPAYPLGKKKYIRPYFSKEIARNAKTYGISPWLPGYRFTYTGQLDQYVKIYSTGARAGNGYLSLILSYFKMNGISIDPESKIDEIIELKKNRSHDTKKD